LLASALLRLTAGYLDDEHPTVSGSTANGRSSRRLERFAEDRQQASRIAVFLSVRSAPGHLYAVAVCTPIGSKFSIEQTITALSAPSRMTSSRILPADDASSTRRVHRLSSSAV